MSESNNKAKLLEGCKFSLGVQHKINEKNQDKITRLEKLIEDMEDALGCTSGDDIRVHAYEALARFKGGL